MTRINAETYKYYYKELPYSEVCMHMKVAGKTMLCKVLDTGMVQLYGNYLDRFSSPITYGEAGFYKDDEGYYFYDNLTGGPE